MLFVQTGFSKEVETLEAMSVSVYEEARLYVDENQYANIVAKDLLDSTKRPSPNGVIASL